MFFNAFHILAILITLSIVVIGSLLVVTAGTCVFYQRPSSDRITLPVAMYPFTAAVLIQLFWVALPRADFDYLEIHYFLRWQLVDPLWIGSAICSLGLLMLSLNFARKGSGAIGAILSAGSVILLVVLALGGVLMAFV
jgi:hypothetical protein